MDERDGVLACASCSTIALVGVRAADVADVPLGGTINVPHDCGGTARIGLDAGFGDA